MRLILHELKKIWNIKLLIGVVVLCALVYYVLMGYKLVLGGSQVLLFHEYALEMTQSFGPTLEPDELEQVQLWASDLRAEADEIIRSDERFAPLGFKSYQELCDYVDKGLFETEDINFNDPALKALNTLNDSYSLVMGKASEFNSVGSRIDALELIITFYQEEQQESEVHTGITSPLINRDHYFPYMAGALVLITLAISGLLSLTLTRDRMSRVNMLQLSSKRGRRIYQSQLIAMLISALAIITAMLAIFTAVLITQMGLAVMWNNPVNSFMSWGIDSLISGNSFTVGVYYLIIVCFAYVLGIGLTLALFCLSGISGNYVSLLAKAIPAFIVTGILGGAMPVWDGLFYNYSYAPYRAFMGEALFEPVIPLLILAAGIAMAVWFLRSRRKAEV